MVINNIPIALYDLDVKSLASYLENDLKFTLGGSRFFARKYKKIVISPQTDFDFNVDIDKLTPELREHLNLLGFSRCFDKSVATEHVENTYPYTNYDDFPDEVKEYLGDNLLEVMYLHRYPPIQILFRSNFLTYKKVFDNMSCNFYYNHIWKSGPNKPQHLKIMEIINELYAIAGVE